MIQHKLQAPAFLWLLFVGLMGFIAYAGFSVSEKDRLIASILMFIPTLLVSLFAIVPMIYTHFTITKSEWNIQAWPYPSRRFQLAKVQRVQRCDLRKHMEMRPRWRTFGMSLGRYHLGTYILRNGKRAFLAVNSAEVFVIDDGEQMALVSVDNPDAFYSQLQQRGIPVDVFGSSQAS